MLCFLLLFVRCLGFFLVFKFMTSFLGWSTVITISAAFAFGGLVMIPELTASWSQTANFQPISAACFHFVGGILIAFPSALALEALGVAGRLIDVSRGAHFAEQQLPGLEERTAPLETFGLLLGLLILFPMGWIFVVLELLWRSFQLTTEMFNGLIGEYISNFSAVEILVLFSAESIKSGLLISAPVLILLLLIDLFTLVFSRNLPRISLLAEFISLKMLLGIIFCIGLFFCGGDHARRLLEGLFFTGI